MAKISSYPSDANVTTSDRLIGSDNENSNETKNFVVGDIITLASSIILPQVAGSYVPYTGATANVDLGTYDLNADVVTTQIVNTGDIYANNLFNSGGNPSIFVGNDSNTPVGLLINTSTNSFKLGDYNGDYNGTFIGIYDNLQQIQFKGGFYVGGGEGTVGNVLLSNGAGVTPSWSSTLNLLTITASNYFINSEMTINPSAALFIDGGLFVNGSAGTSGDILASQGIGLPPTWQSISTTVQLPYLSAHSAVQQTALAANTGYAMNFNTVDISSNISVANDGSGNPTRITPVESGVYNIQFSAQIQRTTGGASATIDIWFKQGGVDIPNSNTSVNIQANAGYLVASWNFFTFIDTSLPNPYVEIMWATTDTAVSLQQQASNAVHPATPSVIVTVNKVSN